MRCCIFIKRQTKFFEFLFHFLEKVYLATINIIHVIGSIFVEVYICKYQVGVLCSVRLKFATGKSLEWENSIELPTVFLRYGFITSMLWIGLGCIGRCSKHIQNLLRAVSTLLCAVNTSKVCVHWTQAVASWPRQAGRSSAGPCWVRQAVVHWFCHIRLDEGTQGVWGL